MLMQLLFSFQGRIRRLHWWLGQIGAGVALGVLFSITAAIFGRGPNGMPQGIGMFIAAALYLLGVWINLALSVKRCHDRDKTGWFVLIGFIPIIGWIWLLIELGFLDGTQGPNKYGPSPKALTGAPAHA